MLQRIYDLKKTQRFITTGYEFRPTSSRNTVRHGIFFSFYSRPNSKTKDHDAWFKNYGVNIPKWILYDIVKEIMIRTKDKRQINKFKRLIKKVEKLVKERGEE